MLHIKRSLNCINQKLNTFLILESFALFVFVPNFDKILNLNVYNKIQKKNLNFTIVS